MCNPPTCALASPQSGSLHLHPYYPEFSSPYPSHLPLHGTTSPPHLQRTLHFHSPPGLTVYAGSFSSNNLSVPGNRLPRGGASFEFLRLHPLPPQTHSDWRVHGGGAEAGVVGMSAREDCPLDQSALPKKTPPGVGGPTAGWREEPRVRGVAFGSAS